MTALLLYLTLGVTAAVVLVLVVYLLGIIVALWGAKNSLAKTDSCLPRSWII